MFRRVGGGSGDEEEQEWKYDFDAPDVADLVKDHKPNFVKAPKRCFETSDGYYSDHESGDETTGDQVEDESQGNSKDLEESQYDEELSEDMGTRSEKVEQLCQRDQGSMEKETFKKVTRAEWSEMTFKEKKQYLKERKKWKNRNTVFIKDDSDNEQLTDEEKEEDLHFSDVSEDEEEKVWKKCILIVEIFQLFLGSGGSVGN